MTEAVAELRLRGREAGRVHGSPLDQRTAIAAELGAVFLRGGLELRDDAPFGGCRTGREGQAGARPEGDRHRDE